MRTVTRILAVSLPIAAVLARWWQRSAHATDVVAIRPNIEVAGATQGQLALARWAVARFEFAGLEPPELEIAFHGDASGCDEHMGVTRDLVTSMSALCSPTRCLVASCCTR